MYFFCILILLQEPERIQGRNFESCFVLTYDTYMKFRIVAVSILCILIFGLLLRLYNRESSMYHINDQGLLLLTSYAVVFDGH